MSSIIKSKTITSCLLDTDVAYLLSPSLSAYFRKLAASESTRLSLTLNYFRFFCCYICFKQIELCFYNLSAAKERLQWGQGTMGILLGGGAPSSVEEARGRPSGRLEEAPVAPAGSDFSSDPSVMVLPIEDVGCRVL